MLITSMVTVGLMVVGVLLLAGILTELFASWPRPLVTKTGPVFTRVRSRKIPRTATRRPIQVDVTQPARFRPLEQLLSLKDEQAWSVSVSAVREAAH